MSKGKGSKADDQNQLGDLEFPDNSTDGESEKEFANKVEGEFGSSLEDVFDADSFFDESTVASLSELGLEDPDSDSERDLFHGGNPFNLQAPPARPGFVQRFIRYTDRRGNRDDKRVNESRRKGWVPRKVKAGEFSHTTRKVGDFHIIMIDGMVLCEMREDRAEVIRGGVRSHTDRNTRAVESNFRETAHKDSVPIGYKEKSETKVGFRKPNVGRNRNT